MNDLLFTDQSGRLNTNSNMSFVRSCCLLFGLFLFLCCGHRGELSPVKLMAAVHGLDNHGLEKRVSVVLDYSEALQCYTCMGSTDEDCNRQGSKACPRYSDACAIIRGDGNGVLKTCSYKSFCSQTNSQGDRVAGVKVHCCYSDNCNVMGHGNQHCGGFNYLLILLLLFWHLWSG